MEDSFGCSSFTAQFGAPATRIMVLAAQKNIDSMMFMRWQLALISLQPELMNI
jgi:hypothetical protein